MGPARSTQRRDALGTDIAIGNVELGRL